MLFVELFDLMGTAAFTVSGVLVGIKYRLDFFGVFVLATLTASGGGLIRDIILHDGMPVLFTQRKYFATITITTIIACIAFRYINRITMLVKVFDALGLGVVTVFAAYKSMTLEVPFIGVLFLATLTGIGGGVIRDLLVREIPMVFKSEIYALASLAGALSFYYLNWIVGTGIGIYISIFLVFTIRMLSVYYKLNLPPLRERE